MEEPLSKSEKKRQAQVLLEVGLELIDLGLAKLHRLPLPAALYQAIVEAKTIKSHGAKKRQVLYIAKLMRAMDCQELLDAYAQLQAEDSGVTATFQGIETWRDRLIQAKPEALTQFIDAYHPDDIQLLRQLVKKAQLDLQQEKNTGAAKALFRYLRSVIL